MNIPQIYLVEPYNAYASKQKKKHWMQEVDEQNLLARIIAEQQALQEAASKRSSNTLPPQAPETSVPTIVGTSAGEGASGGRGSGAGGGGMPVVDFFNPTLDTIGFSATPTTGIAPLTVTFTEATTGESGVVDTFTWNFGDGTTGVGSPVTHVYDTGSAAGYTVQLTESFAVGGTGSLVKAGYISASIPSVTAGFTFITTSNNAPFSASFTNTTINTSQTPTTTYLWTFTGGTPATSTAVSPNIAVAAGNFTASLQATGSYNIDSKFTASFSASI